MSQSNYTFTVFTKPWKMPLPELGAFVKKLGFDGIELPVRPGYQVEPENIGKDLPKAVAQLRDCGISIESIAGNTDEATIAACGEAGVPIIRVCESLGQDPSYWDAEKRWKANYDALVPILAKHGVAIGIQNHCDRFVCNAMGLHHLVDGYDPKQIAIVWDAAHNGLDGERTDMALDMVWSHLRMVNLKNAIWTRTNGPVAPYAEWKHYWTSGRQGLASWPVVASELKNRGWKGVICLTAEYSDDKLVDRLIKEDIEFAKELFE